MIRVQLQTKKCKVFLGQLVSNRALWIRCKAQYFLSFEKEPDDLCFGRSQSRKREPTGAE